jgi:hypothetical protein
MVREHPQPVRTGVLSLMTTKRSVTEIKEGPAFRRRAPEPLPADAENLPLNVVAGYLGTTIDGVRALLRQTHGSDAELSAVLLSGLVKLSPRRRFIRRSVLMAYFEKVATRNQQ